MITHTRLLELLHYDPETGIFTRLVATSHNSKVGEIAGGLDEKGYVRIRADGTKYKAHRLAFFYMTGRWPDPECDHEDLDKANNRWGNLREATTAQNCANQSVRRNSKSGIKGVYWDQKWGVWRASCRNTHLGGFPTKELAAAAYAAEATRVYGEFARVE